MRNRNKIIILLLFILLFFTSCEEINGVLGLLPKFDSTLPNNISGKWVYFENEEFEYDNAHRRVQCNEILIAIKLK